MFGEGNKANASPPRRRVMYMVDVAGQSPRAVEEWRLSPRREGEER
jgi:hypothetical protein